MLNTQTQMVHFVADPEVQNGAVLDNHFAKHIREASSEGAFVVDVSGLYSRVFDNEFSLFASKDIAVAYWRLPPL